MPLTCPVCRAANDAGPACRRCRADLSLCFAVEGQREAALAGARTAAAAGQIEDAIRLVESAVAVRAGTDTDKLLAVLHLLAGDYAKAWKSYRATAEA